MSVGVVISPDPTRKEILDGMAYYMDRMDTMASVLSEESDNMMEEAFGLRDDPPGGFCGSESALVALFFGTMEASRYYGHMSNGLRRGLKELESDFPVLLGEGEGDVEEALASYMSSLSSQFYTGQGEDPYINRGKVYMTDQLMRLFPAVARQANIEMPSEFKSNCQITFV